MFPYPFSDTKSGIRKLSCGDTEAAAALQSGESFGSANRCKAMHLAKNPSLFKACAAPFAKTARFAHAAAPAFAFCPSGSPTPRRLFCRKTFSRRLARRFPAVLRDVFPPSCELADMHPPRGTGSHRRMENKQIRRFVRRWAARESLRPPKKAVCKKPPVRGRLPGGETAIRRGNAVRWGMPSDGECRPMGNAVRRRFSQARHGRRQANFAEIRRLKGKLSTYPHGYPQCRRFMP